MIYAFPRIPTPPLRLPVPQWTPAVLTQRIGRLTDALT